MLRIKGQVGSWPVDLSIELDAEDWANLAGQFPQLAESVAAERSSQMAEVDTYWQQAQQLLEQQGQVEGPQLFAQLSGLLSNEQAAKRLLVRLRHCPQVRVDNSGETPLYCWQA